MVNDLSPALRADYAYLGCRRVQPSCAWVCQDHRWNILCWAHGLLLVAAAPSCLSFKSIGAQLVIYSAPSLAVPLMATAEAQSDQSLDVRQCEQSTSSLCAAWVEENGRVAEEPKATISSVLCGTAELEAIHRACNGTSMKFNIAICKASEQSM